MRTYHKEPPNTNSKNLPSEIPGGVYMISPLAAVSVWAALKMKLIAWCHLCVWIALWEVRTWRDTRDPAQRNLFIFTLKRVAQALGNKRAGPRLMETLADLERLGLARLTPDDISFTKSLEDLPADLRAETDRMLKSLGNCNVTRAIPMPRRLMRLVMKSRSRPLRAAVVLGMLLRIMPVKRYGWYKGCLTTALLFDVSGFNESRIKHERAALIREGYFERLETPARVRNQHGDWYALNRNLPSPSGPETAARRQPPTPPRRKIGNPLVRNQLLPSELKQTSSFRQNLVLLARHQFRKRQGFRIGTA